MEDEEEDEDEDEEDDCADMATAGFTRVFYAPGEL